jgi:hypothetical protein
MVRLSAQKDSKRSPNLPSRFSGSDHLIKVNGTPPPNARLFTAEATAMYTNIEPAIGIAAVQQWLIDFDSELP